MKIKKELPKLVVILGPTASGKTDWSLRLSKKFNGEIISADSRQIYKKMDIGTAKAVGNWKIDKLRRGYFVDGVKHYLIDFLDPGKTFTVAEFKDKAVRHARSIKKSGKTPFLVGGTGLYISSVVDNLNIPRVAPNKKMRKSLEEKSLSELFHLLQSIDPQGAKKIDRHNKRRIIRALEVSILSGEPFSAQQKKGEPLFQVLQIGIVASREVLYNRINERVEKMIENGLLTEVQNLINQKYDWHLPSMSGVGYRQFKDYFAGGLTIKEVIENLKRDTRHFARRQFTWFKRDASINWIDNYEEAEKLVEDFLKI